MPSLKHGEHNKQTNAPGAREKAQAAPDYRAAARDSAMGRVLPRVHAAYGERALKNWGRDA